MNGERGATLIEVLVAVLLLAILLVGIVPGFMNFTHLNTRNERRSGAVQAARVVMEGHRLTAPSSMPSIGSDTPTLIIVGDRDYLVTTHYCTISALCNTNSRHLVVEVIQNGEELYTAETVFTELR